MTAIFISHRSSDNIEANALRSWLSDQGHEQLFLDFDPADGIPAGVDWEQRLYQELRRCQALLIVLTPAWLESKWCGNELAIAREKGKAVFVVRVKACADGPLIPAIQEVDLTVDREAGLAKLARGLKEHGLDPASAFDWKPGRPIYPGLAAFDVDDAAIFFGRSEESWQAVEALRRLRLQATGSPKLLLITGASGSGKSSLMRAGVLARLRKEPANWIVARPFRRGGDGLASLAEALAWAFPLDRRPASLAAVAEQLSGQNGADQLLEIARELRLALDRPDGTLILALDQAEELLVAEQAAEDATRLLDLFRGTLARVGTEILVLASIRSDRLGSWQQHGSIRATAEHGELLFEMLPLGPVPMARIGEIVRGPAAYEGLRIDDDLVDAIRGDTPTADALPLLAYTLQYLHNHFAADGRLSLEEYRSFGGLEGSVRSQADAAIPIERLSAEDGKALQEAFVPGLVRATVEGGFSRSRALLATLPARAEPYLRRLVDDARLLTADSDPQGGITIEVAHEALLRVWPTLTRWIEADALNLRRLEALQRAAADWAQNSRGEDFLIHRDHRLTDAEALVAEPRFGARLDATDRDYLSACRNAQDRRKAEEKAAQERELLAARELAEEQKSKIRRTRLSLAAVGLLVLISVFSVGIFRLWSLAEDQKLEIGRARQGMLAAIAQRESERGNLEAALALAREASSESTSNTPATAFARTVESAARLLRVVRPAVDTSSGPNPIATEGLRTVLANYHEKRLLSHQSSAVVTTSVSGDGGRVLTVDSDGEALATDVSSGHQLLEFKLAPSPYYVAALSRDGSLAAFASFPSRLVVWSVDERRELYGTEVKSVTQVRFADEVNSLLATTIDGSVFLISLIAHDSITPSFVHGAGILSIDYSSSAGRFVLGSTDGTAVVWDQSNSGQIALQGHTAAVRRVRFSPDGMRIATASGDRTAIVWDSSTGTQIAKLLGHEDWVTDVVFSPDDQRVLTTSLDRTARLWDIKNGRERCRFVGHQDQIIGAIFSDATTVVTASYDGMLRIWDSNRCALLQAIHMSTGPITNLLAPKSDPGLLISDAGGRTWWWSSRPLDINKQSSVDEISAKIRGMAISPLSCKDRNNLLAESNSCTDEEIDFQIFADNRFFVEALYFVLRFEGGYIQHPGDPISTTNKGIPQKRYDEWRSAKGLSARDVKEIDDSEVVQIYFEGYWLPPHCGSLPPSLGILLFDTAVNMGSTPAVKFMATELGLDPDAFATQVRAAVAESGQTNVAARYIDAREARYRQLVARRPQLGAFMKGWLARLDTLARSIGVDRPDTM